MSTMSYLEHFQEILAECHAMVTYVTREGRKMSSNLLRHLASIDKASQQWDTLGYVPDEDAAKLGQIHARLSEIIAPAKPLTVLLLQNEAEKASLLTVFGPVPLIRHLMLVAIGSLMALISLSLSTSVNGDPESFSLLHNNGVNLLMNLLFILSAASIGASFINLFTANTYIREGTFDPTNVSTYWTRLVLGIMAGFMLAMMIPIESFISEGSNRGALAGLAKPTLAMLGGFSASAVYKIIRKIVSVLEASVTADNAAVISAQEKLASAKIEEQGTRNRMELSNQLNALVQKVSGNATQEDLLNEVRKMQERLFDYDLTLDDTGTVKPPEAETSQATKEEQPSSSEPAPETKDQTNS